MKAVAISSPLVAAIAWTVALIAQPDPLSEIGAMLTGIGLLMTSAVSVVGMAVSGGQWSHRFAIVSIVMTLLVAALRPIDAVWVGALILSALALFALFTPPVTSRIRKLPAAAGPPRTATAIPLILLTAPFLLGVTLGDGSNWAGLLVGLSAPLAAFLFSRVIPGGLLGVRIVWPVLAVALSPLLGLPAALSSAGLAIAVMALAWRSDVKASFHPPAEAGTTYPIPPELTPQEILDAARIDDQGKHI